MAVVSDLNQEQRAAAHSGDGPVLIVAGPGTGKTKTLTARIAYLIAEKNVEPEAILALTFTNKAAQEMQYRVSEQVPGAKPRIATFHALCHELLGDETPFVTDAERLQVIRSLSRPQAFKGISVRELGLIISRAKNQPELDDPGLRKLVRAYSKALAAENRRDFDDLLQTLYQQLRDDAKQREQIQARYRYVLVDEFQDTNRLQYELLKLLLGHQNIFVIGDPNQSIYGFRGASGTIFEQFKADFPKHLAVTLTINYRSVPEVVNLANAIFGDDANLTPASESSGQVRAVEVLNEYSEAEWVLGEIQRGIGGADFRKASSTDERSQHRRLSDFAVIYRSRSAARAFQKAVADSGLPYQVVGDGSPYDTPHIQAILSLLRAGVEREYPEIEGLGGAQRSLLEQLLLNIEGAPPAQLAQRMIEALAFEVTRDIQQFLSVLVRFTDIPSALAYFDDIAERGFYDPSADAITLLTIHASKGLEFPQVFLLGAEEGILPAARSDEAEERRLFYVAVTRARERLEITHARNRGSQPSAPSRFLNLANTVLGRHVDPDIEQQVRRIAKRMAKKSQTSLF